MRHLYLFLGLFIFLNCSSEDNESETTDPVLTASDFSPNSEGSYWIYNVDSTSDDLPEMDFTSNDSLYIVSTSNAAYTLDANNGMGADGSINSILTSGSLSTTDTTLTYSGALDLPIDIVVDQALEISDLILIDLEADNGTVLSTIEGAFTETIDIQGSMIPINVNFELFSAKEDLYDSKIVNGVYYTNVYEGTLNFNLSVTGTITIFGFGQNINIIESQNILSIRYYYGANIGLLRAESEQGFELAPEVIALIDQTGGGNEFPSSTTVTGVEALINYEIN
ncbi:hypothetical protein N9H82_06105 [Flavobacteriaceae bacterium]|nr:hypothetical protein [Flavobacteriaceae bacterium]